MYITSLTSFSRTCHFCSNRQTHRWRTKAKPGSRLEPHERAPRIHETALIEQIGSKMQIPPPLKFETEPEGIRRVNDDDIEFDAANELKLLEGPLEGSFRCFSFHEGSDVYVSQDADGRLNLARSYLYDRTARVHAIPKCSTGIPDAFLNYQVMLWDTWVSGDAVAEEEETTELYKAYFVKQKPLKQKQDYPHVDFHELYCIDGEERSIMKPEVLDLTNELTTDPVLSIKEGSIVIQDSGECITPEGYGRLHDIVNYIEGQMTAKEELTEFDQEMILEAAVDETLNAEPDLPYGDQM